jgi:hypothetical protein
MLLKRNLLRYGRKEPVEIFFYKKRANFMLLCITYFTILQNTILLDPAFEVASKRNTPSVFKPRTFIKALFLMHYPFSPFSSLHNAIFKH